MVKRYSQFTVVIAAGLVLAGCVTPDNDRITLGRTVLLESLTPAPTPAGAEISVPVGAPVVREPSVVGLDRSNWEITRFHNPVDGTAHRLLYGKRLHIADRTARQRGEYPTAESALELTGGSIWQQQAEAAGNPVVTAIDLLLLVPRMVWAPPWRVRWSPDVAYERSLQPDRDLFPEVVDTPLEDPFAAPPPHPVTPTEPRPDER